MTDKTEQLTNKAGAIDADITATLTEMANLLSEKQEQSRKLLAQLITSTAIKNVWPEAFDCGSVKASFITKVVPVPRVSGLADNRIIKIKLTRSDGVTRYLEHDEALQIYPEKADMIVPVKYWSTES